MGAISVIIATSPGIGAGTARTDSKDTRILDPDAGTVERSDTFRETVPTLQIIAAYVIPMDIGLVHVEVE